MKKLSFGIIIFILAVPAFGGTYNVDADGTGDYETIQAAVDAAMDGDIIVLQPGTYSGRGNCNIDYKGKDITISSVNPDNPGYVKETIIDCYSSDFEQNRAFIFQSGETQYSVVEGITIQNGYVEKEQDGAGIFCTNASSPMIENCVFRDCTVLFGLGGGAIACVENSSPYIVSCTFSRNRSKNSRGGAIFSDTSSPTIENCIFRNNISSGDGGAICASGGNLSIFGSELSGNEAGELKEGELEAGERIANGGAVSITDCNLIVERCDIINNAIGENCVGKGGALWISRGTAKIVDSNVSANAAYDGGGIYCTNYAQINIERCRISKNSASSSEKVFGRNEGGGIFCENTSLKMKDCVISYNRAHGSKKMTTGYGGGVFMHGNPGSGFGSFTNCLFIGNLAWADNSDTENGCGGGLYAPQTRININFCTFAHNTAKPEGHGSGFYSNNGPSVTNSIFWANQGDKSYSQIYDSSVKASNSDIQGGWPGKDNINADPCFVSGPMGQYYLSQESGGQTFQSPCVDKGSDTAENLDMHLLTTSKSGKYDTEIVDMGYHYIGADVPGLDVSPDTLIIELKQDREKPEPRTITISNSGNGALRWTATTDVNWMILDVDSGTCKDYEDFSIINVDADITGLNEGRYIGTVTISDPYARNSPKQVMVELRAVGSVIGLSQSEIYIDAEQGFGDPAGKILGVFNMGGGVLKWNLSDPCDWLKVEPDSGSSTTEVDDVNIIIDTSDLTVGTHTCMLTVTAEGAKNSPQNVMVQLNMVGPMTQLSQDYFSFENQNIGESPSSQILTIRNAGGGVLNWKIKEKCHWLSIKPQSGTVTNDINDFNDINIAVDISGLKSGIYTCQLEVFSNNDTKHPQIVSIQLTVTNYNAMDLDKNMIVDFSDYAILAPHLWRRTEAPAATERGQAPAATERGQTPAATEQKQASSDGTSTRDVNSSIDFEIFALFCQNWLDTEYPELRIPDLVSHWKLDGDVKDSSGSNHGVPMNRDKGKWKEGKIDQGLDFERVDDRVVIEDDDSLTPSEELSVTFWIYTRDDGGGGIYKTIDCNVLTKTDDLGSYSLQIKPESSLVEFTVFGTGIYLDNLYSFGPISTNSWHHIAATFDRSDARIYVDGMPSGSLEMKSASIRNDSLPLRLGCRWEQCDKDKFFLNVDSILDDVRIYSRALTELEIQLMYLIDK